MRLVSIKLKYTTRRGYKLNFYNEVGGQLKDFAHPT